MVQGVCYGVWDLWLRDYEYIAYVVRGLGYMVLVLGLRVYRQQVASHGGSADVDCVPDVDKRFVV